MSALEQTTLFDMPATIGPDQLSPLKHTPASLRGDQRVAQCAHCGTLVCTPSSMAAAATRGLGACPACGREAGWWRQELPVGMFGAAAGSTAEDQPA